LNVDGGLLHFQLNMDLQKIRVNSGVARAKQWDWRFHNLQLGKLYKSNPATRSRVVRDASRNSGGYTGYLPLSNRFGKLRVEEQGMNDLYKRFPVLKSATVDKHTLWYDCLAGARSVLRLHEKAPLKKKKRLEHRIERAKKNKFSMVSYFPYESGKPLVPIHTLVARCEYCPVWYKVDDFLTNHKKHCVHNRNSLPFFGSDQTASLVLPDGSKLKSRRLKVYAYGYLDFYFVHGFSISSERYKTRSSPDLPFVYVDGTIVEYNYRVAPKELVKGVAWVPSQVSVAEEKLPELRNLRQRILSPAIRYSRKPEWVRRVALICRLMLSFSFVGHLCRILLRLKLGQTKYRALKSMVRILKLRKLARNRKINNIKHQAELVKKGLIRFKSNCLFNKRKALRKLKKVKIAKRKYRLFFSKLFFLSDSEARSKYGYLRKLEGPKVRRSLRRKMKRRTTLKNRRKSYFIRTGIPQPRLRALQR